MITCASTEPDMECRWLADCSVVELANLLQKSRSSVTVGRAIRSHVVGMLVVLTNTLAVVEVLDAVFGLDDCLQCRDDAFTTHHQTYCHSVPTTWYASIASSATAR